MRKEQKLRKQECLGSFSQRLALVWIHSSLISLLGIKEREMQRKRQREFFNLKARNIHVYTCMYVCIYLFRFIDTISGLWKQKSSKQRLPLIS